jgi:tyrosyl-tRNA synthetase
VVLIGGGTAHIGDPSGRSDMRTMMTKETIDHNCACFKKQMERFIEFGEDKAIMVNNADWLLNLNYVELLRDVGAQFSVNNMLRAECYKQRMEKGLSFLEFNYMIMQAYDFWHLHNTYGCNMQFGGDDQWSNMLAGTELIRKKEGEDAYAMTITLLLNSEGKKMGKTAKGAVWLDPEKTTPFEFFQYWRNVGDQDVMKCLRMLTFLSLEEIHEMDQWDDSRINEKKEILAYELTKLVHGEEAAQNARNASHALFAGGGDDSTMPTTELTEADLTDGEIGIMDLLTLCKMIPTRSEGRRLIQQGGVTVNEEKVASIDVKITAQQLKDGVKIRKGKKVYHKAILK